MPEDACGEASDRASREKRGLEQAGESAELLAFVASAQVGA